MKRREEKRAQEAEARLRVAAVAVAKAQDCEHGVVLIEKNSLFARVYPDMAIFRCVKGCGFTIGLNP